MDKGAEKIERLFRAAAPAVDSTSAEVPFGFETRVFAAWRARRSPESADLWEVARVFRRVAVSAIVVTILASGAALWQFNQNDDVDELGTNAYAIADNAIEAGAFQ